MKRVCVFVDGENFRKSIVELFSTDFDKNDYLPKVAKWGEFFDWLVALATNDNGERIRTYWYVVKDIDYRPRGYEKPNLGADELKQKLCRHAPFRTALEGLEHQPLIEKMQQQVRGLSAAQNRMRKRSDGWVVIQNGITTKHDSIEFRRAGSIAFDLFKEKFDKEKAVDVKLACDMIVLNNIYDFAIIVSGDQDYVPAVMAVKDFGKKVINVAFKKEDGTLLPGGAIRLNHVTDGRIVISYDETKSLLFPTPTP